MQFTQTPAGIGFSTDLPDLDFETYSEAGFERVIERKLVKVGKPPKGHNPGQLLKAGWSPEQIIEHGYAKWQASPKWQGVKQTSQGLKGGISVVGAYNYASHPSARLLSLSYDLKQGRGPQLWIPGSPDPQDLFDYISSGGLLCAWNSIFEYFIWLKVCHGKMGWPMLPLEQLRDDMAKAMHHGYPGKLEKAAEVSQADVKKDMGGSEVMKRVSVPRTPTTKKPWEVATPHNSPDDFARLYLYNIDDIRAERAVSRKCPDLSPQELDYWLMDQRINARGVHADRRLIDSGLRVVNAAMERYNEELRDITNGGVQQASNVRGLVKWCRTQGLDLPNGKKETIEAAANRDDLPDNVRRALQIRQLLGSAAVKKLPTLKLLQADDNRIRDLFKYYGAQMTGRWSGADAQPHNFPNSGPPVKKCDMCGHISQGNIGCCRHGHPFDTPWNIEAMEAAINTIYSGSLDQVEAQWGDAVAAVSGCLRGVFMAPEGHDHIASDFSAIEAVGAAAIAGEEWRLEVFRTHGKIYEASAAEITGKSLQFYLDYAEQNKEDHPDRKKFGKPMELGCAYGGWINAPKVFGADKYLDDDQIKTAVLAWRAASPRIVEMWGGQYRKHPDRWEFTPELYGLEGAFIMACLNPGQCYGTNGITYGLKDDVMYCRLHSGRTLTYHRPRLQSYMDRFDRKMYRITFEGWNNDPKRGPVNQWIRMETYSGRLFENVVQAESRDIMAAALYRLEQRGYPIVLHVHDEACAEVPAGFGAVEEFEEIMAERPQWAVHWPIKASGGWRGARYRK